MGSPSMQMPERSPFTSAAKTGTPALQKPSAMICRVTVLPVPVAPVTRPWRLAMAQEQFLALVALAQKNCVLAHAILYPETEPWFGSPFT